MKTTDRERERGRDKRATRPGPWTGDDGRKPTTQRSTRLQGSPSGHAPLPLHTPSPPVRRGHFRHCVDGRRKTTPCARAVNFCFCIPRTRVLGRGRVAAQRTYAYPFSSDRSLCKTQPAKWTKERRSSSKLGPI